MRLTAFLAVGALLLLMVPLVRIAVYTVPWYDDYSYGNFAKDFLAQERSLRSALEGALYCAHSSWYAWQGTFSSVFFMSLVPSIWGEKYYFLGSLFLIAVITVAVFVFLGTLLRGVLKADWASCIIIQAVSAAMVLVFMYSSQSGFFWYNAGVHYVAMHSFLLLTASCWIRLLTGKPGVRTVLFLLFSAVGTVLAGGANYVTALQGLLLACSLTVLGILLHNKKVMLLLPSLVLYGICFYYNTTAPGNARRQYQLSGSEPPMTPLAAIGNSFLEAVKHMREFTGIRTLAALLLILPVIWLMLRKVNFRFRYPGVLLLWSFCFYATGFTPSLYSLGHAGLGRTLNAVKITWQLLLVVNEIYWTGWFLQKAAGGGAAARLLQKVRGIFGGFQGVPLVFYLVMGAVMICIFAVEPHQAANYSSFCAYWYVHTGEANEFHKEYLARVETILNGGRVVEVTPYHFRPAPICVGDLSENPEEEPNRYMAVWYDKEAIICRYPDTQQQ